jgi:hypothetical protein
MARNKSRIDPLTIFVMLIMFTFTTHGSSAQDQPTPTATSFSRPTDITLFPGEIASRLFWLEKDQSFVVGLGSPFASEYTFDYESVDYTNGKLTVRNYSHTDAQFIERTVTELNLPYAFDTAVDGIYFVLAPDNQYAVYVQNSRWFVFDVERQTSHQVTSGFPIGKVDEVIWMDKAALFIVEPPCGSGVQIVKLCLERDCFFQFDSSIQDLLGVPAISDDQHFAVAASLTTPNVLYLIDLTQPGVYQTFTSPSFFIQGGVPPIWADNDHAVYVFGSDGGIANSIYHVTLVNNTLVTEKIAVLDDELGFRTMVWLIDTEHRRSIHALRDGEVRIYNWQS